MTIEMTNREFQELRKFLLAQKNQKVNKAFNEVFSKDPTGGIKGFVNPINNNIVINIPEALSYEVMKVFVNHAGDIAKISKGGSSITNAPKWLSCIKSIANDITNVITHR